MTPRILTFTAAILMLSACDDEGYSQKVEAATMCVGSFASVNRGQLEGATTTGACSNDRSLDVACTVDVATTAGVCGQQCVTAHFSDDAAIKTCTTECMQGMLADDPTTACLDCYSDSVVCTKVNCLTECQSNPNAPACLQCRSVNGCFSTFFTCTGFPAPGAGDAGP